LEYKQAGAWPDGRRDMRPYLPVNYRSTQLDIYRMFTFH